MYHHRAMLCIVTAIISDSVGKQKIVCCYIQIFWQAGNYKVFFVLCRETVFQIKHVNRFKHAKMIAIVPKDAICPDIVRWCRKSIDKICWEQIFVVFRINKNIGKRSRCNAEVCILAEKKQQSANTVVNCSRRRIRVLRIYRCIISLIIN